MQFDVGSKFIVMLDPQFRLISTLFIRAAGPLFGFMQAITPNENTAAIGSCAKHIVFTTVIPEKGGHISSHILTANHRGDFAIAQSWKEFDDMVTESLRKCSGDGHLYVRNYPAQVERIKKAATENAGMNIGADDTQSNYGFEESK